MTLDLVLDLLRVVGLVALLLAVLQCVLDELGPR